MGSMSGARGVKAEEVGRCDAGKMGLLVAEWRKRLGTRAVEMIVHVKTVFGRYAATEKPAGIKTTTAREMDMVRRCWKYNGLVM